ncbi:casein kinase 2 regulatory subunit [Ophidiomyces ophidiicola]|nr:casein kinase 2 regulatory subunit [Ophidiomyces ophidiicola]KAI1987313.1 casein kinase 2 regulatory subunit [Ophidiomyces ophidiicola]KAI1990238.1 casein kinase 2 regulatory subunit [Ophidiomyces ophidiicola]
MSVSSGVPESWISAFCSLMGHEYFAEVSEDFIEDDFNLTGLQSQVPKFKEALEMILDVEPDDDDEDDEDEYDDDEDVILGDTRDYDRSSGGRHIRVASDLSAIETSAELLYGLIHQRYITSRLGIQQMLEKYERQDFGICPRVFCQGCRVLPVGRTDTPGLDTVKLYCPSCQDLYTPPNSRFQTVDGAFFGTTFGCLFFMSFPELDVSGPPDAPVTSLLSTDGSKSAGASSNSQPIQINGVMVENLAPGLGQGRIYEAKVYGFKVSERARSGPRMKWLRMKPDNIYELDESAIYHAANREAGTVNGDTEMDAEDPQQAAISRRKKAPIRKRRVAAPTNPEPMNTNGAGELG